MGQGHGIHNALIFSAVEISLPLRLEKYRILDLLVIGNEGPLILVCSNARVTRGFSIFGNTFNTDFLGVSHRFETPITGYNVMASFVLLAGFEFSVGMYG